LVGSVLQLNLTRNSGAAFSIGTGATWILTAIACSVVVFVVVTARRLGSRGWALALGLLLGGSLGNLTDRMFRAPGPGRGQVVDFLQLPHYPIFNIADSAIVSAAVLIAVMAFRGVGIDGTRASSHTPKHNPDQNQRRTLGRTRSRCLMFVPCPCLTVLRENGSTPRSRASLVCRVPRRQTWPLQER
jgi:signal peptidase II